MVRRLVIPIDTPASVVAGVQPRGQFMTDAEDHGDAEPGESGDIATQQGQGEVDAFAAAVVHSKVRSPAIRPSTLERPRLLNWLERHASARLRVIAAEAGYGKSTLLADHARRSGRRTLWYRLEPSDRDWMTFLSYVVASVREIAPSFGAGTVSLLQQVGVLNTTRDLTLDTLLAELESVATEPLSLILDDFHAVQDSDDVRAILVRLLEHAPTGFSLVIASRDRPTFPMARLSAQAGVAELATEDLRFTRSETADLFAYSYGTPIDDDLVAEIDERLEGWGSSLQLVGASLLALRPKEIRTFVRDLSAHSEPLRDFLVEEVLSRQTPVMRRVLIHASLLERISPHLLAAATADPRPMSVRQITVCLYRAEDTGMITRIAAGSSRWRLQPLIREVLRARLLSGLTADQRAAMHLRVAIAAEPSDWLAASHHFLEAGHPEDGMRVLRDAAMQALGTASWGQATDLLDRMPDGPVPLAATVIRARGYVARGQAWRAVEMLEPLAPDESDAFSWGLLRAALANAYMVTGQFEKVQSVSEAILRSPESPKVATALALGFTTVIAANHGGSIATACDVLVELGDDLARQGLPYFAAVSFHNAALGHLARGRYSRAVAYGRRAIVQLELTPGQPGVESTHVVVAMALWELGEQDQAERHLRLAIAREDSPSDAQADGAWILGATGDIDGAWILLGRATRDALDGAVEPGALACVQYSRVLVSLVAGDAPEAASALEGAGEGSIELDAIARHASMAAMVALAAGKREDAMDLADEGARVAVAQGASHWEHWLRLLRSVASSNRDEFRRSLHVLLTSAKLSTLALADVVLQGLPLLDAVPDAIEESIARWPKRWLPALRSALRSQDSRVAQIAAQLLAKHGTLEDVALLSAFERQHVKAPMQRVLGRQLARHANPTLILHDLGHVAIAIGDRRLLVSQTRRRTASLLAFLASRPNHSATKELVLESLWPRQSPAGAANSLHQALFYLRRDVDPWFNEAHSVHYLVVEPELVFFDRDLVQVDSSSFLRQATAALMSDQIQVLGPPLLRDYKGTFAPEFEYEDWSMAWRVRVHSTYLQLVQKTSEALLSSGAVQQGIDAIGRALIVDSSALDLEASLIVALLDAGATAAAAHQYSHFVRACEAELGLAAPSLSDLHSRRPDAWPSLRNAAVSDR